MVEVGGRKLQRVRKKQNTGNGLLYACAILYHCSLKVVYLATFLLVFRVIRYTGTCKKLFYCIWEGTFLKNMNLLIPLYKFD